MDANDGWQTTRDTWQDDEEYQMSGSLLLDDI